MVHDVITRIEEASRTYLEVSERTRLEKLVELSQSGINLFGRETIDFLHWPETEEGQYAKKFLRPLVKQGTQRSIKNVHADVYALKVDHHVLPVVVAHDNEENSYVCSPYGHYFGQFAQSMHLIEIPVIAPLVRKLVQGIGKLFHYGRINSVVYVNNWLFSTDLYPKGVTSTQISLIVTLLKKQFPHHAIVFRSLNTLTTRDLLESLKGLGFKGIMSRQVFIFDATQEAHFKTRIIKSDLKLWRETEYQVNQQDFLSAKERAACLKLYNSLYVDHHSYLNPQFSDGYLQLLIDEDLLRFIVLKSKGEIKGVAGYLERNGVMFCPFFGYEKDESDHQHIYRLLNTALLLEAQKGGLQFHMSSGASFYKTVRRAKDSMESMAVYTEHLPFTQKILWGSLRWIMNTFAPRFMKKY